MVVYYDVFDFSGDQSSCRTDMWLYILMCLFLSGGKSPRHTDMWLYPMMCLIFQVASRRVVQICGCILILLSILPKFSLACVMIPQPVVGGLLLLTFSEYQQ